MNEPTPQCLSLGLELVEITESSMTLYLKRSLGRPAMWCLTSVLVPFSAASADEAELKTQTEYTLQQALTQDAPAANTLTGSVSLDRAVALAIAHSRLPLAEQARKKSAMQAAEVQLVQPDPVLQLQLNNLPVTGERGFELNAEPITRKTIGIEQRWVRRDRREKASEIANAQAEQFSQKAQSAVIEVKRQTAKAWLQAYFARQRVDALQSLVQELDVLAQAASAQYQAGTGPQAQVFSAQTEHGLANLKLRRAQALRANALDELERWVGQ
ncbi:MAG: TolC family protein, partial [Limnobacter sp.]|nr:TolC family protein [Limnobacter sp.]